MKQNLIITLLAFLLLGSSVQAGEGWLTNVERATEIASKDNRDILVDFTGSDWCSWCIRLHQEVFDKKQWKEEGASKYVQVVLDYPRRKKQSAETRRYNANKAVEFGIRGYPTIFILDSSGKPYAKTGYQRGGPQKYLDHLSAFENRKAERDSLLKQALSADKQETIKILQQLVGKLEQWQVAFAYPEIKVQLVDLDVDNERGLKTKYAAQLYVHYASRNDKQKSDSYFAIVEKYDKQAATNLKIETRLKDIENRYLRAGKWDEALKAQAELVALKPSGQTAQTLYFQMGAVYFNKKQFDKTIEYLKKSVESAPNTRMAAQLKRVIQRLESQQK